MINTQNIKCWKETVRTYYKYGTTPNVSLVGSPTVSDGVISNFSSSNYGKLNNIFNPLTNSWEMVFKIKTPSSFGNNGWIIGGGIISGADYQGITFGIHTTGATKLYLSSTGSGWNIASGVIGNTVLTTNTNYYFKLQFTGSAYIVSVSTDGESWTVQSTTTSSLPIFISSQPNLIGGSFYTSANAEYWRGSIDLKESYIKINNEMWWHGTKAEESTSSDYDFYKDVDTYYGYKDSNDIYYGFDL